MNNPFVGVFVFRWEFAFYSNNTISRQKTVCCPSMGCPARDSKINDLFFMYVGIIGKKGICFFKNYCSVRRLTQGNDFYLYPFFVKEDQCLSD